MATSGGGTVSVGAGPKVGVARATGVGLAVGVGVNVRVGSEVGDGVWVKVGTGVRVAASVWVGVGTTFAACSLPLNMSASTNPPMPRIAATEMTLRMSEENQARAGADSHIFGLTRLIARTSAVKSDRPRVIATKAAALAACAPPGSVTSNIPISLHT